jgi:transcriptional regulator with XRE-family HTH domain
MPPSVAREIEFLRRQLGLSQAQLASMIGRSQGQLANALRGHDPISRAAVNRLREVLVQNSNSGRSIISIS